MPYKFLKTYCRPQVPNSTNDPAERVAVLPLTKGLPYSRHTVLSLTIPANTLAVGDILDIRAEWQTSSKLGYTVMVAGYLLIADAPTRTAIEPGAGFYISQPAGHNIIASINHLHETRTGLFEVPASGFDVTKDWHVNVILYAASTAATAGAAVTVNAGHGRLCVLHNKLEGAPQV